MLCIECPNFDYFMLKRNFNYETILFNDVTVRSFLVSKASAGVLDFINKNNCFINNNIRSCSNVRSLNKKYKF